MYSAARIITFCAVLLMPGSAQVSSPTAEELERLEQFVSQPGSRVISSKDLGHIAGGESDALITAVIVQGGDPTKQQMRGIRIQFTTGDVRDQIYVAEEFLQPLVKALVEIEAQSDQFLSRPRVNSRCFGSGAFLSAMRTGAHFFHASQCSMSDGWTGLSVSTGSKTFRFTGLNPAPFRTAIARAATEFEQR